VQDYSRPRAALGQDLCHLVIGDEVGHHRRAFGTGHEDIEITNGVLAPTVAPPATTTCPTSGRVFRRRIGSERRSSVVEILKRCSRSWVFLISARIFSSVLAVKPRRSVILRLGRVFEVLDRFDAERLMQEVHALWAEARDGGEHRKRRRRAGLDLLKRHKLPRRDELRDLGC
jgi:hypothetical protein